MTERQPMPERYKAIVREVAQAHGVPINVVFTKQRRAGATEARLAAYAKVRATPMMTGRPPSYPQIGRWFGRDNSTIFVGVARHLAREARSQDPQPPKATVLIFDRPDHDKGPYRDPWAVLREGLSNPP